jgi:hypothetical protein
MEACVDLRGPRANPLAIHRSRARACRDWGGGVCTPCGELKLVCCRRDRRGEMGA